MVSLPEQLLQVDRARDAVPAFFSSFLFFSLSAGRDKDGAHGTILATFIAISLIVTFP